MKRHPIAGAGGQVRGPPHGAKGREQPEGGLFSKIVEVRGLTGSQKEPAASNLGNEMSTQGSR
jgi:hypothetical protein